MFCEEEIRRRGGGEGRLSAPWRHRTDHSGTATMAFLRRSRCACAAICLAQPRTSPSPHVGLEITTHELQTLEPPASETLNHKKTIQHIPHDDESGKN